MPLLDTWAGLGAPGSRDEDVVRRIAESRSINQDPDGRARFADSAWASELQYRREKERDAMNGVPPLRIPIPFVREPGMAHTESMAIPRWGQDRKQEIWTSAQNWTTRRQEQIRIGKQLWESALGTALHSIALYESLLTQLHDIKFQDPDWDDLGAIAYLERGLAWWHEQVDAREAA